MAETIPAHVVSQFANLLVQETAFLRGVRDQIKWVETELHLLQGFLKDAYSRRKRGDATMESWISEIRDGAYEMEDVIDTIKYLGERRHQRRGCMGSFSRYSHKPCESITINKIDSRIKQIKTKIQSISDSRVRYSIANLGESSGVDDSLQALRQFPPHFYDDTDVVGLEDDKEKLVKQLVDPENKNRNVVSIVGMGGLGKTTLARKVHDDPAIREHFETFAWVSVSQNCRVIELLKNIMKKVTTTGVTLEELEQMGEEEVREMLHDFPRDKRYLAVMDDVWTADVWRQMHQVFPNGNNGSRILLTTRKIEVARHAEPWIPPHELQLLNDAQSLELLCRKAFPPNQDVPTELEALAQKLAKRCGGLPLALVVLGGLLSLKDRSYDTRLKVAQSMNWESSGDGQEFLRILGLSYDDLPYPLKPCFLHIAAFPEDSTVYASKLVMLWIAEGFILQEQRQTMEDTARDWLDELVQRCVIQVVQRSMADGGVTTIRIHDMLRDLGQSEARNDGCLHVCNSDDMAVSTIQSYIESSCSFPQSIWKLHAPSKVKGFLWRVFLDKLNTRDRLFKKTGKLLGGCVFCSGDSETSQHLFLHYSFATSIWRALCPRLEVGIPVGNLSSLLSGWVCSNFPVGASGAILMLAASLLWCIWVERNNSIFLKKSCTTEGIIFKCLNLFNDWSCLFNPKTLIAFGNIWNKVKGLYLCQDPVAVSLTPIPDLSPG